MILTTISNAGAYRGLSGALDMAIDWLAEHISDSVVDNIVTIGKSEVGEVFAKYESPALLPREKAALEAHRRYIDIHVPLKDTETIGWAPVSALQHPRGKYDQERDVIFYGDAAHSLLHVKVGQMAIFFPDDAHAPNIGLGNHRKICIKIPVD